MLATPKNFQLALKKLNTEQRKAVETIEGPVMVLAGPGTGKTQVVALRIAQILSQTQMGPNNILALTFTEAGVTALRDRLIKLIGPTAYRVTISTFHGFSNEVIGIFPHLFTQTQTLRLISDAERFLLIEEILNNEQSLKVLRPLRKPDLYVYEISQRIKTAKQENVSPDELKKIIKQSAGKKPTESEKQRLEEFVKIYQQYNSQLSERGWYDYEDTIVFVVDALKTNEEVRAYFQERYQYMLVDEYQDTNNSQNALVGVLADFYQNPNLFVVGDDKQAIYRFQGASVANMLHFKQRYPEMVVINLKQNYRSSPEILAVAKELISHNRYQINKLVKGQDNEVVANLPSADPVTLFESTSSVGQLAQIIQLVETYQKTGTALPQIAVLWRKRENVKQFAQFAQKNNLPISGQVLLELFDEPAVRSLLNLLSAIAKPTNNLLVIAALRPILSDSDLLELYKINRSIRSTTPIVEKLLTASKSLRQTAQQLLEVHKLSDTLTVQETIEWLMDETKHFQKRLSLETLAGAELLLSFYNLAAGYADQKDATLISFLEYTQMVRSRNLDVPIAKLLPENGLFIGTVHSAKGLEFERVILAGVDEKNWSLKSKPE
ncbi:MAG: ATP-dependent helicase, partial [Patescibacteria group bacterium]